MLQDYGTGQARRAALGLETLAKAVGEDLVATEAQTKRGEQGIAKIAEALGQEYAERDAILFPTGRSEGRQAAPRCKTS